MWRRLLLTVLMLALLLCSMSACTGEAVREALTSGEPIFGLPAETQSAPPEDPAAEAYNNAVTAIVMAVVLLLILGGLLVAVMFMRPMGTPQEDHTPVQLPVRKEPPKPAAPPVISGPGCIQVLSGNRKGQRLSMQEGQTVCIGKEPDICHLVLGPENYHISRMHCTVTCQGKKYYVVDCSTNGTFCAGNRLIKGRRTAVPAGSILYLADSSCQIRLQPLV